MLSLVRRCNRFVTSKSLLLFSRANGTLPHVKIRQGELKGTLESLSSGGSFASFKGIPYAKPPLGNLRFRAPQPAEAWTGVRDASEHGSVCPHWDMITGETEEGDEDCLFLNVYSPDVKGSSAPVMVWFHGGAFQSGSGDSTSYAPDYLVEEGVVVVTVNYRLEVLGFLSLDTKDVPGNAGMKDQVAALRWVKENISNFGGDPNNVTIFGESSGAAAVTCHLVSPMSKGLFHKVIAQSGTFFNEWCISIDNVARALRLGKYFGKDTKDANELASFLRTIPSEKLIKSTVWSLTEQERFRGLPIFFSPTVEKEFEGEESFFTKHPTTYLKENHFEKVPMLIGYNDGEGMALVKNNVKKAKLITEDFTRKIPRDIARTVTPERLREIGELAKKFYFPDGQIGKSSSQAICDLESDYNFSFMVTRFAKAMAKVTSSPVYLNRFCFDGELSFYKKGLNLTYMEGACHGDDMFYLFKTMDVEPDSREYKAMKRMTKIWTNMAKYGNPTPVVDDLFPFAWKPITPDETNYLNINDDLEMKQNPDNERYMFWDNIYKDLKGMNHF